MVRCMTCIHTDTYILAYYVVRNVDMYREFLEIGQEREGGGISCACGRGREKKEKKMVGMVCSRRRRRKK